MRVMEKKTVEVEEIICDGCGKKIEERCFDASITIKDRINGNSAIIFEWWPKGDYCKECGQALVNGIIDAIPVPERCDANFTDKQKAIELEHRVIESWYNNREPNCCSNSGRKVVD